MKSFRVFYSNRQETLVGFLHDALFSEDVFKKQFVVVHSAAMKSWLNMQLAQQGIAMGYEILYLHEVFPKLIALTNNAQLFFPTEQDLSFAIESEIKQAIEKKDDSILSEPLLKYLKIEKEGKTDSLIRKRNFRLTSLSHELASCFCDYGRFGLNLLQKWSDADPSKDHWQKSLWKAIFEKRPNWHIPLSFLSSFEPEYKQDFTFHFFLISYLNPAELEILHKISLINPINYYLLSPCSLFWEDICSDRERVKLLHKIQTEKKRSLENDLDHYLKERNTLLANHGKLGKSMAASLEEVAYASNECYQIDEILSEHPLYEEKIQQGIIEISKKKKISILDYLQADFLLLRNPSPTQKIDLCEEASTIEIHGVPNKLREIEVLYNNICSFIEKENFSLGNIVVMAPHIEEYEPYIKAIFGSSESQLSYQILDIHTPIHTQQIKAFLHLLKIKESRWDVPTILELFNYPVFCQKFSFREEEIDTIKEWIQNYNIQWGLNKEQRNEIIRRQGIHQELVEKSSLGTWENGLELLIEKFTLIDPENNIRGHFDKNKVELIGSFYQILLSLEKDLQPFDDEDVQTLESWINRLHNLFKAYLNEDKSEEKIFQESLDSLARSIPYFSEEKFPFATIQTHLKNILEKKRFHYLRTQMNSIYFCSFLPMRSIPAKVICLLGMQEGNFPRNESNIGLNLLQKYPIIDFYPNQRDFDRYLFLETLLSARNYLLISYVHQNGNDGKEQSPSLVIVELLNYLENGYTVEKEKYSQKKMFKHPLFPFHHTYFKGGKIKNFFPSYEKAAQTYYQKEKTSSREFFGDFSLSSFLQGLEETKIIDIKWLQNLTTNPFQFYCNKKLGIFFNQEEPKNYEEKFDLDPLEYYRLQKKSLLNDVSNVLEWADKNGHLPTSLFKDMAKKNIQNYVLEISKKLEQHRIDPKTLFSIHFQTGIKEPTKIDKDWFVPPMKLEKEGKNITIIGEIKDVSPQGLLIFGKEELSRTVKYWPQFLLLHHASKILPDLVKPKMIFTEGGIKESFLNLDNFSEEMEKLVAHFHRSQNELSFLLSEWVPFFLKEDPEMIKIRIMNSLKDNYKAYKNPYTALMLEQENVNDLDQKIIIEKNRAIHLFASLKNQWYD